MEQEVFVPVPAERLRAALADPAQVARAVPGLQQDAGTEPVAGRLKVRIGGHTITYRGAVRVSPREDGAFAVEGDATEARGSGVVKLALTLRLRESDEGATLRFEGAASADGRIAELPTEAVDAAVVRLLSRFAENLGATVPQEREEAADPTPRRTRSPLRKPPRMRTTSVTRPTRTTSSTPTPTTWTWTTSMKRTTGTTSTGRRPPRPSSRRRRPPTGSRTSPGPGNRPRRPRTPAGP